MTMKVSRPPWESVPPEDQLFILITGANGGIGYGTAERIIDEFLATRSSTTHLILLPTARSPPKCLSTISSLRAHVLAVSHARHPSSPPDAALCAARIHVVGLPLDLCDIRGVYAFADRLSHGTVSNPPGLEGEYVVDVAIPRIDSVICNAGFGGWSGFHMPALLWGILRDGFVQALTWPACKAAEKTAAINAREEYGYPAEPKLGEVFAANVFGHYLLARRLLPLLTRPSPRESEELAALPASRIVWCGSLDTSADKFRLDDFQCFDRLVAYESAKRLIDLLSLSSTLPASQPHVRRYLNVDDDINNNESDDPDFEDDFDDRRAPPQLYLAHPGVVASTLMPLHWVFFWPYRLSVAFARWLGSPWHNASAYVGSVAAVWIALSNQDELDDNAAARSKWGSATDTNAEACVKATEVEGWGFEGLPETKESIDADQSEGALRRSCGRKADMPETTAESIVQFEEQGAKVWQEMEALRNQWEKILHIGDYA